MPLRRTRSLSLCTLMLAEGRAGAVASRADAVAAADELAYSEPADWFYPVRHYHGAALLRARQYAEAEAVYLADLERHPANGWTELAFKKAWMRADITLTTTGL